jgi:hypothetical protein
MEPRFVEMKPLYSMKVEFVVLGTASASLTKPPNVSLGNERARKRKKNLKNDGSAMTPRQREAKTEDCTYG